MKMPAMMATDNTNKRGEKKMTARSKSWIESWILWETHYIENAEATKNVAQKEEPKQEPQTIKQSNDWEKSWGKMEKMIEKYHD